MILHSLLALATCLINSAFATSFYIRPFSEFTATAPHIIRGVINNIHTENSITPDGAKTIYTYATLDVKDEIKGAIGKSEITIRKIGGSKDGYTLEIPSSPEFTAGEETVLFLTDMKEDSAYEVTGLELGKFGLEERNGESVLTGGIFNYSKPGPENEPMHNERAKDLAENQHPWTVNQLKALVKEQVANPPNAIPIPTKKGTETSTSSSVQAAKTLTETNTAESKEASGDQPETRYNLPYLFIGISLVLGLFYFLRKR